MLFHLGKSEQISLGNAASLKTKGNMFYEFIQYVKIQ